MQALILLLHQVAHYCEGTTSAGTLLPLGTTSTVQVPLILCYIQWVLLHLLHPVAQYFHFALLCRFHYFSTTSSHRPVTLGTDPPTFPSSTFNSTCSHFHLDHSFSAGLSLWVVTISESECEIINSSVTVSLTLGLDLRQG